MLYGRAITSMMKRGNARIFISIVCPKGKDDDLAIEVVTATFRNYQGFLAPELRNERILSISSPELEDVLFPLVPDCKLIDLTDLETQGLSTARTEENRLDEMSSSRSVVTPTILESSGQHTTSRDGVSRSSERRAANPAMCRTAETGSSQLQE